MERSKELRYQIINQIINHIYLSEAETTYLEDSLHYQV